MKSILLAAFLLIASQAAFAADDRYVSCMISKAENGYVVDCNTFDKVNSLRRFTFVSTTIQQAQTMAATFFEQMRAAGFWN